jgi:hypothetical protein
MANEKLAVTVRPQGPGRCACRHADRLHSHTPRPGKPGPVSSVSWPASAVGCTPRRRGVGPLPLGKGTPPTMAAFELGTSLIVD